MMGAALGDGEGLGCLPILASEGWGVPRQFAEAAYQLWLLEPCLTNQTAETVVRTAPDDRLAYVGGFDVGTVSARAIRERYWLPSLREMIEPDWVHASKPRTWTRGGAPCAHQTGPEPHDALVTLGAAVAAAVRECVAVETLVDPAMPAVTCYRCLVRFNDRLHLRLHRLQCSGLSQTERDTTAAALARDLGFIPTRWPKKSRIAGLLATSARKEAKAAGYPTVTEWLRCVIFPACFMSAIADLGKPTRHRFGPQFMKDESGSIVEVAPIALPLPRLEWWLKKETQRRAEPILLDLLQANALPKRLAAALRDGTVENPRFRAYGASVDADAQRDALLRELYRLCDPDAGGFLRPRERQILRALLGDVPTYKLQRDLQLPSRGALYAAAYRLKRKLPDYLRAALRPQRRRVPV
jgi:hypothetical protein